MTSPFVVLTGCSGGGKSTLLEELRHRGHQVVPEPGRRIVQGELANGGDALPWLNLEAFARRAMQLAQTDLETAPQQKGWTFFDRGLIDAAAALRFATGEPVSPALSQRYHPTVFFTPPWPEIYVADPERRHGLAEAVAEYQRLQTIYHQLGYKPVFLPKTTVEARATFVLQTLGDQ